MSRPIVVDSGPNCKVTIEAKADAVSVKIAGWINEDVNFGKIAEALALSNTRSVAFDMIDVTQINSCGVREWLLFLERLQPQITMRFDSIGEVFIEQANIVPNLLGGSGTEVRLIQVPYFCDQCQSRAIKTLHQSAVKATSKEISAPFETCPKCKSRLEFDGVEAEYFNFITHARG